MFSWFCNSDNNNKASEESTVDTKKQSNELDLVFVCDCTSSMSSYIETAKQNIRKISEEMHAMEARDMRYGLVCYRDHPPQDSSYATKVFKFTPSIQKMQSNIDTMSAEGGGDGPESFACALRDALNLDYRKDSVRVCVVIADAPPHGLGESDDGFPKGCPCGVDPLAVARKMLQKNIVIYCVACEPNLGNYKNGRAFYKGIADLTHGRYLSLGSAHLLPKVIIGGSAEELDLKKFEEEVRQETVAVKAVAPSLSTADVEERVWTNLQAKGVRTWHLDVSHQTENIEHSECYFKAATLESARMELRESPALISENVGSKFTNFVSNLFSFGSSAPTSEEYSSPSFDRTEELCHTSSHPISYECQTAEYYHAPISKAQVCKVMARNASH